MQVKIDTFFSTVKLNNFFFHFHIFMNTVFFEVWQCSRTFFITFFLKLLFIYFFQACTIKFTHCIQIFGLCNQFFKSKFYEKKNRKNIWISACVVVEKCNSYQLGEFRPLNVLRFFYANLISVFKFKVVVPIFGIYFCFSIFC